jgi:predicted nucleic acid-binding protein
MIMLDLNVILDVVQRREPHYQAAAAILSQVVSAGLKACVPAHAVTTLYYIVAKHSTKQQADNLVDWLLQRFEIASTGKAEFMKARNLPLRDFEDAVVVSAAEALGCQYLITSNVADFTGATVPVLTPEEFLNISHLQ